MNGGRRSFALAGLLAFVIPLLGGCGTPPYDVAVAAGWQAHRLPGKTFTLLALRSPGAATAGDLHVYIEGDGRAWWRGRPTRDPTPTEPTGLALALADPAPGVLYLARPCQYVDGEGRRNCDPAYWTHARFAPEVVADMDAALAVLAGSVPRRLVLFGYSGGGAVAALIAARRDDVDALVTVAAPLDHAAWTRHHDVSPLTGSLDAMAAPLPGVAEVHLAGGKDTVVPADLVRDYAARRGGARVVVIPAFSHDCCWADRWPEILQSLGLSP